MPKNIDQEAAPIQDNVRIGIELEGVGTVTTDWKNKKIIEQENFHAVFKRTPLVRSPSFNELTKRGVYITPEDSQTFGTSSPAELVSSPHIFDVTHLGYLRDSFKKAFKPSFDVPNPMFPEKTKNQLNPMSAQKHPAEFFDKRLEDNAPFQRAIATSRWARNNAVQIAGNLQTTVGVAVANLLADDKLKRDGLVQLLIGDDKKQAYARALLASAILMEQYLTKGGGLLEDYVSKSIGIRLAAFMYLVRHLAARLAHVWTKTALGANFKGCTSFKACAVAASDDILVQKLATSGRDAAVIKNELIEFLVVNGVETWITDGMKEASFDVAAIGQPGHSLQTSVEKWYAIDNFMYLDHLYTVVEAREKSALLNIKMCEFLKEECNAGVFFNLVKTYIFA